MKRLAALAAFALMVVGSARATAAPAAPAAPRRSVVTAPTAVASCPVRHVLMLLDQSGSLRQTDPGNARVTASQQLVDSLAAIAPTEGAAQVAIAGFDGFYQELGRYSLPSGAGAARALLDTFRTRNTGDNTDYVVALSGAAKYFAGIDAPAGCKTLVWFTDGAHDVESLAAGASAEYSAVADPDTVTAELSPLVCGPIPPGARIAVPVSESLRTAGVDVRLSELRTGGADRRTDALRRNTDPVLESLFTAGNPCAVSGERDSVSTADDLGRSFFRQAQAAEGASDIDCRMLTDGHLPAGPVAGLAFRLPPGGTAAIRSSVAGPIRDGAPPAVDVAIPSDVRDRGGELIVSSPSAISNCFVRWDAAVQVVGSPTLYQGASAWTVDVSVARRGHSSDPGLGPDLVGVAAATGGADRAVSWDADRHVWAVTIPAESGSSVDLSAGASLRTAGSAVSAAGIQPLHAALPVSDLPPRPSVAWTGRLRVEGKGHERGSLVFRPRATVPGAQFCVSVDGGHTTVKRAEGTAIADLTAPSEKACGPYQMGSTVVMPASIDIAKSSNSTGALSVDYSTTFQSPDGTRDLGAEHATLGQLVLTVPPDRGRETLIMLALTLASLLIPLALLWGFTYWQSRLPDPDDYLGAWVPMTATRGVSGGMVSVARQGELAMEDLQPLRGTRRRISLPGGGVLKARLPRHPFAAPAAEARFGDADVAASTAAPGRRARRGAAVPVRFPSLTLLVARRDDTAAIDAALLVPRRTRPAEAAAMLDEGARRAARLLPPAGAGARRTPAETPVAPRDEAGPRPPRAPRGSAPPVPERPSVTTTVSRHTPPPLPPRPTAPPGRGPRHP